MESDPRCPICANRGWHPRAGGRECDHCGIEIASATPLASVRRAVRRWLSGGGAQAGWRLAGHAARNAAWSLGFVRDGGGWRPAAACGHDVALAIMARATDAARVSSIVRALGFPRAVVLLDGAGGTCAIPGARVAWHPLDGDFAAQRNRLQAMAGEGWVLQLDSDERPGRALLAALGWLVRAADADGLRALGLPRRNLVDGRLSSLYPDIQYRLVRADIRFAGHVHERPAVSFAETSLALAGTIRHRLSGARVRERTRDYGMMARDGARPQDEAALLLPYRGPPSATA